MNQDQTLTCCDCGTEFVFSAGEQSFFLKKGFSRPKRCQPCRARVKLERQSKAEVNHG